MKKIKITTIILLIILVVMVSFFGIYTKVQNRMENKVKEYSLDMDLKGARYIKLSVNKENKDVVKDADGNEVESSESLTDEEIQEKGYTKESVAINKDEDMNEENYKRVKEVIEKRLADENVTGYEISLNNENGDILVQIPEDDNTDEVVTNIKTVGKFEIIDSDTKEVLMDNGDIKSASVMYGSSSSSTSQGTTIYLDIEFNKQGTEKLKNISTTYVKSENNTTTNTTTENTETEDNTNTDTTNETTSTTEKKITMKVDDQEIMSTSFDKELSNGKLQLSIGSASTDNATLEKYEKQAREMASVLDSGNMPLEYKLDTNEYRLSDITNDQLKYIGIAVAGIILIGCILYCVKYKLNGLLSAISFIGLIGIYMLVIRYTNVIISIQGILGIISVIILNYILVNKILSNIKNSEDSKNIENVKFGIKEAYKEFFVKIIPICISVVIFCFASWSTFSSFGMIMFWGILIMALYNFLITSTLLKIITEK